MRRNKWLVAAGMMSIAAALLHLAIIAGGPDWYRFFGAGEGMARAAERGSIRPTVITLGIATILLGWALFALSGSGLIRRLPLLRTALVLISAVLLLRALAPILLLVLAPGMIDAFVIWSSAIVLVFGLTFAIGTSQAWHGVREPG